MSLSTSISNTSVQVNGLTVEETADGRVVATLTIYDAAGAFDFQPREPVSIIDTTNNYSYNGYVNDDQKTPMPNGVALTHVVSCIDETDIPMKRIYAGPEWTNRYAGDIVTDLTANVLAPEGITANYAIDEDRTVSDWQQGTQTNTTAISTATGGALQLASAGSIVTKTESTAAQWNAGTLTGAMTNGNLLQLNAHPTLSFSGVCSSGYGNAYAYYRISNPNYIIQSGDKLRYKMWINSSSPQIMAGVDAICTDGTSLRDFNSSGGGASGPFAGFTFDQNGLRCHPGTDLSGFANDQWYSRTITFQSGMNGKVISYVDIAFEGDSAGTYQAYFYDIWIENSVGTITQNLFGNSGVISPLLSFPNLSAKVSNIGYSNIQINAITAYEATGTRISAGNSIQAVGIYQSSLLSWLATTPDGTSLTVYTSVDGGATYQLATNQAAITNIPLGALLTSRNITTKIVMSISGKDPTATPQVSNITWTVNPAYAATQTGTRTKFDTQADFNGGTLSETLTTSGGDLTINSVQHQWNDGSVANQTLFGGGGGALQSTIKYAASLRASTTFVAQSRLDFASNTWQNFIVSIDVQVPAANVFVGLEYRQTFFDNNPNTGAYLVDLSTTSFNFGRGTNNATNTHTNIQTTTFSPALTVGDWHTITIVVNGNSHTHYLDGVQYWIPQTDATFTGAGYFVLRNYNNSGGDQTCYYDNFGVMPIDGVYPGPGTFSGPTWTSASISLGSFTAGNNLIFWDASTIAGDYLNVQTNFNGAGYVNATNNAPIPGIVIGTPYVSATLQVKVQMQAATAADTPVLHGLTTWVTSQYSSSGSRISPALSLAPVGVIGSTSATWLGSQPTNTTINIDTSTDGSNWLNIGTGASGAAAIAGLFTPTDPVVDDFSTDTSANYTSTCRTGGTIATWNWNTALRRIEASGGTNAHLLYNSPVIGSDVDEYFVMDASDNGGFVWRWLDQGDHYALAIHDASSLNNPNVMELFVVTGGGGGIITPLTLYNNLTISSTLGTMHQASETLGSGTFTTKQSTIGTASGFGELFSTGNAGAWAAGTSLLDPSTNNAGFLDDGITLEGNQFIGGVWTPSCRLGLNVTASITADIWCRVFKRSSGGTITSIGDCVFSNQTITQNLTTYVFPGATLLQSAAFATGDKVGYSWQLNVLTNTNGLPTLACKLGMANTTATGLTNSQVVSPGFQAGSAGATTLLNSVPISFVRGIPHAFRVVMVGPNIDIQMDGQDMIVTGDNTITSAGFAGLRTDSAGGASSANFYLFRLQYFGQNVTAGIVFSRVRFTSTDPTVTPQLAQLALSVHDPNIQNGALIPQTNYSVLNGNKMTVLDIFNDLAKQSENFWLKIIDFSPYFQAHQATPAPWVLTPQGATSVDIMDNPTPMVNTINDTYRNSQWGTGGTDVIAQSRSFIGNGTETTFDVGFNIDSITSITLGGVTQTFGVSGSSTGVQWYYTQGQSSLVQDTSGIPISGTNQTLIITFNAQVGITVNVQSPTEIARIQQVEAAGGNPTTGIIDYGEDMSRLPKMAIITKCAGELNQWGQENRTLTFSTMRNGLAIGQLVPVFASPLYVFAGAYLLVHLKMTWDTQSIGGGAVAPLIRYDGTGVTGSQVLSWARFINSLGGGR